MTRPAARPGSSQGRYGTHETAGKLLGGITALPDSAEFALIPVEVAWYEETVDQVRSALGSEDLERVLAAGLMTVDELARLEFIDSAASAARCAA